MKINWISCTVVIMYLSLIAKNTTFAQEATFDKQVLRSQLPIPQEENQLFYLQRDPDSNTIIYTLNLKNGHLDTSKPVKAYWIRYAENGQRKNLSLLQENMAYGVQTKQTKTGYTMHIKAYKALSIYLVKDPNKNTYSAEVEINNNRVQLEHLFVRIKGGSFFHPNIDYIEITGKAQNGVSVQQRIKP